MHCSGTFRSQPSTHDTAAGVSGLHKSKSKFPLKKKKSKSKHKALVTSDLVELLEPLRDGDSAFFFFVSPGCTHECSDNFSISPVLVGFFPLSPNKF
jgi:hypothetical protein